MALDGVERPGQHDPQLQRHICTTGRWFHDTLGTPTRGTLFRCCSMSSILISRHLWRCAMFDLGVLALRLVLGAVFLGHGAQKAFGAFGGPGFAGATGFVGSLGFRPARVWAALAVGGELAAGVLFLLGLLTPLAGLLVLATMVAAIAKVHGPKGFFVQNGGEQEKLGLPLPPPPPHAAGAGP